MDWLLTVGLVLIAAFLFIWWNRTQLERRRYAAEGDLMRAEEAGDTAEAAECATFIKEAKESERGQTLIIKLTSNIGILLVILSFFF